MPHCSKSISSCWPAVTDLGRRLGEQGQCLGQHRGRGLGYALVRINAHDVSAENGRVFAPFFPDRIVTAAKGAAVHNVIVDEGEGMEHFQACGGLQDGGRKILGINAIRSKAKPGTDAFAADGHHIAERVVETGGLSLKLDGIEKLGNSLV